MCVVSNVMDGFNDRFQPWIIPATPGVFPVTPVADPEGLRKLIDSFKETVDAAKLVDKALGNADCVDPEKAKLLERIKELEALIGSHKWIVKLGSMYWGFDKHGEGWIAGQKNAKRFLDRSEAGARAKGAARVVRLT